MNSNTLSTVGQPLPRGTGVATQAEQDAVAPGDIAVGVVIGRASEYFDFFVYGIASVLVFPAIFFPHLERLEGLLWSFALLALAFVVRPIGTLLGMALQRRFDRGVKLTVALFLLGISTCVIAVLPGYNAWGTAAIAALALARIGQGLALGGSWDGLPSLLAINAPEGKRGWYAMLGQLGAPTGFLIAASLFAYLWGSLNVIDFLSWGWRFPFFAAFALNVVALFARLRLVMTHEYEKNLDEHELDPCDTGELFREQGYNIFIGAFAALASFALFHLVTVFPLSWLVLHSEQSVGQFLTVQIIGALLAGLAMPISGLIADRIGRRSTLGTLAITIGIFSLFIPILLDSGAMGQNIFILVGFVLLGLSYGQAAGAVTSNFLPRFRYTGAALTSDLAWLFGAAFAPLVALGLSIQFGLWAVTAYLLSGAVVTLVALRTNRMLKMKDRD